MAAARMITAKINMNGTVSINQFLLYFLFARITTTVYHCRKNMSTAKQFFAVHLAAWIDNNENFPHPLLYGSRNEYFHVGTLPLALAAVLTYF